MSINRELELSRTLYNEGEPEKEFYDALISGSFEEIKKWKDRFSEYFRNGLAPIHVVAMTGRDDTEEILKFMLENGVDVNMYTRQDHNTVLHCLIKHNHISVAFPGVVNVLDYYPDITWRNRQLRTPYDVAVAREYFDIASCLDGSMMPADARALYNKSVGVIYGKRLIDAVLNDDEDAALVAIKRGANCNMLNKHGCGAIHYLMTTFEESPMKILRAMHDHKCDLNLTDSEGDTVLNLCIKNKRLKFAGEMNNIVAELIRWGALSTFKDLDGKDALELATERNYTDIVRLIKKTRSQHILEMEHLEELKVLEAGLKDHDDEDKTPESSLDVDFEEEEPKKPLSKNPRVLFTIIEEEKSVARPPPAIPSMEPEPKQKTPRVETPVEHPPPIIPSEGEDEDDEEETDDESINAEELADLAGGDDELQKILNDPDADVNQPNQIGLFPLHLAVMNDDASRRRNLIKVLMDREADINCIAIEDDEHDQAGNTPLHIAVWRNHATTVKQLLSYKPDHKIEDLDGKIPRDIAVENSSDTIVELLDKYDRIMEKLNKKEEKSSFCTIL